MDHTTGVSHALAATTITVAGVTTGLSYEVLLAGFAGSLASMSYLKQMGLWGRLWSLVTSTITAGYMAPVFGAYLARQLSTDVIGPSPLAMLVSSGFVLGLTAQALIPGALWYANRKSRNLEGRPE